MGQCKTCLWWLPNQSSEPKDDIGETIRLCLNPKMGGVRHDNFSCDFYLGENDPSLNIPNHTPNGIDMPQNETVPAAVEVFIVTYAKDYIWLEQCLRAFRKYCSRFQGITVAHPSNETQLIIPFVERFGVRLHGYDEIRGKGFVQHELKMAEADWVVPSATQYIFHLDSDCIFKMPTTPADYFTNNKPDYLVRSWESLITEDPTNPGSKVISDCHQWRQPTDAQLGFPSRVYSMCRHPTVFPVSFYAAYRNHLMSVHKKPLLQYFTEGRNEFPSDRMDFTAMGAFAFERMHDDFNWIHVDKQEYPKDRQQCYHSHSGITPVIRAEIESFLR